jgi:hypothetical protein
MPPALFVSFRPADTFHVVLLKTQLTLHMLNFSLQYGMPKKNMASVTENHQRPTAVLVTRT